MATASKTQTLQVVCPRCMNGEGTIKLDLNNLNECECSECSETFTATEAAIEFAAMAERWRAVADWVASAPVV